MIPNGIINVDKPAGWTSQDVCAKLRKRLGTRRVGHTGTLDPMAVGVLPVAFGKATRIIEYYDADVKVYRTELQLGVTTDTLDATGTVLEERDRSGLHELDVLAAVAKFQGDITQIPPKYSALKVNGKRLYEYAREGKDVEIKPRRIHVLGISDVDVNMETGIVGFTVACSKGTYIRTICDDIGRELGCGAHMTELIRIKSGVFSLFDSLELDDILSMDDAELEKHIYSMDSTLEHLGSARLTTGSERFLNGMMIGPGEVMIDGAPSAPSWSDAAERLNGIYRIYSTDGEFLGTSRIDKRTGAHKPDKVIAAK